MRGRRILTEVRGLREQTAKDRETKLEQGRLLGAFRQNEEHLLRELRRAEEKNLLLSVDIATEEVRNARLQSSLNFCGAIVGMLAAIDVVALLWWVTR